jgi:hypothetical protein
MRTWVIPGSVFLAGLVTTLADGQPRAKAPARDLSLPSVALTHSLERMPLYFIENCGQLDSRVAYYVQGRDTTLYFTAEGVTLVRAEQRHDRNDATGRLEKASLGRPFQAQAPDAESRWVVKLDFVGANPNPRIEAVDPTPAIVSYFHGPKDNWKAGLSTYASIVYSELWPGIDLVYSGTANRLKYTFLVKPGADPAQVRLGIAVDSSGNAYVAGGEFRLSALTPLGRPKRNYKIANTTRANWMLGSLVVLSIVAP